MAKTDHIICFDGTHNQDAYAVKCLRCGTVQRVALPISITCYVAMAKAFGRSHRNCRQRQPTEPTEQTSP